jgi:hypothetical protein
MLNTSEVANGGRLRTRLYAMMPPPEKAVFDRWARRISAFYLAVAALLIAVATTAVPPAENSATASLRSTSTHAAASEAKASEAKMTKRN